MRMSALMIAAAATLTAVPAFAGAQVAPKPAIRLAQVEFCVGPDCRERSRRDDRFYDRDDAYDREWRFRRDERERRCRDITIRERRGDEVVIRRERRCE